MLSVILTLQMILVNRENEDLVESIRRALTPGSPNIIFKYINDPKYVLVTDLLSYKDT